MSEVNNTPAPYGYHLQIVQGDETLTLDALDKSASAESAQANLGASWSFGPLTIDVSLDGSEIKVTVKILGITVANLTLDAANPKACINVSAGIASAKLCIGADFSAKRVYAQGEVCTPFTGCKSFDATIFNW